MKKSYPKYLFHKTFRIFVRYLRAKLNQENRHIIDEKSDLKWKKSEKKLKSIILILSIISLVFGVSSFVIYQKNKEKVIKLSHEINKKDSIVKLFSYRNNWLEQNNKNLELYNRDLNAQKKFYENLKPFEQKNILPLILDLDNDIPIAEEKPKKIKFISPLDGYISDGFNKENNHLALDIVSKSGEPVKAIADGTVIFTDWTPDTGFIVIIDHGSQFLSIYKHNLDVYKKIGEKIKRGDIISSVGNTGEFTTGPHLHLEIWKNGHAVDPEKYIPLKKSNN